MCLYNLYIYVCVCVNHLYKIRCFHKPFDLWRVISQPRRGHGVEIHKEGWETLGKASPFRNWSGPQGAPAAGDRCPKTGGMLQSTEIFMASFVEKIWSTLRFFGVTGCYRTYFLRYSQIEVRIQLSKYIHVNLWITTSQRKHLSSCSAWSPPILYSQSSQMSLRVVS